MANLSITASDVKVARIIEQLPDGPADETVTAGQAVRYSTSTGKYTKANGTTAAEARIIGICTAVSGDGVTISVMRRGFLEVGSALSGLNYDAAVYLSDTDGTLADAAGTVSTVVGRVVPGWAATTADKLLFVAL